MRMVCPNKRRCFLATAASMQIESVLLRMTIFPGQVEDLLQAADMEGL